jgi:hypothetical protein
MQIGYHQARAFTAKTFRRSQADAAGAAGNDDNPISKLSHCPSSNQ